MNYEPVSIENQVPNHAGTSTNENAGTSLSVNAGTYRKDAAPKQDYVVFPLWTSLNTKSPADNIPSDDAAKGIAETEDALRNDLEKMIIQEKAAKAAHEASSNQDNVNTADSIIDYTNSTNSINTASSSVNTTKGNLDSTNSEWFFSTPVDDIGIFGDAYDDRDDSTQADMGNLEPSQPVSPTPTTRVHKDHPKAQILGDHNSARQTRSMFKKSAEHAMVSYVTKQRRTNHKDFQNCLFACFLSQMEPKKVSQALTDHNWIEAMQEELMQFKLQNVWVLVNLPKGKRAIGSKWVYRNKKDERGI
ncbi:putative ribonuclease H-like domain-containing protein, partial [Tanacetum coccineum]